jgi:DNA repair photolyase
MPGHPTVPRGRGAAENPPNRFEPLHLERDADWDTTADPAPATLFLKDHSRTIIAYNDSPDVGFEASINPYRGCEHGCAYCYARPTHEYLGFSAGLDFESKIMVKTDAPELLRRELSLPKWKPQIIALSGVTDCYQPVERKLRLTRRCLEVLAEFRNPVVIVTKNHLVTRDTDVLQELARHRAVAVYLSVTTLDATLTPKLEPRASLPNRRLAAVEELHRAGVAVGALVAPVIPGLTDHEIPAILAAVAKAGAQYAGFVPLRLPHGVAGLFEQWLERHFPARKEKVLSRIRTMRGGRLNDPSFGSRMRGEGFVADQIEALFAVGCRKAGLVRSAPELSAASFRVPLSTADGAQPQLPFLEHDRQEE